MKTKIFFAVSTLVVLASALYYFVYFLPRIKNKELELQTQMFNYQKEQDAIIAKNNKEKEVQNNVKEIQKAQTGEENSARAECSSIAQENKDSFMAALQGCQTQLCRDILSANKDLQKFGPGFVQTCTENKLKGVF